MADYERQDFKRRVCFVGHALLPGELSTLLIEKRMREVGLADFASHRDSDPGWINWLGFPYLPKQGEPVWVDIQVIPMLANIFWRQVANGMATSAVEKVALDAIASAAHDQIELTVGWGALTKNAIGHGQTFIDSHPELAGRFNSTHGDAGTAYAVLQMLAASNLNGGFRVAIIGANGATAEAIACGLFTIKPTPTRITLVGKPDKNGHEDKLSRLEDLRRRIITKANGNPIEVVVRQGVAESCRGSNVVIVAIGGGSTVQGSDIEPGSLVIDMATPRACQAADPDWNNKLVLAAGCCQVPAKSLPVGFGRIDGHIITDMGAGGDHVVWGCLAETMINAATGKTGHIAGTPIPDAEVERCQRLFLDLGMKPQPPKFFGESVDWSQVRRFPVVF